MSVLGEAEAAIETATGTRWVRLALKLAPYVAIVALAAGLLFTRATLARVRLEHQVALADQQRDSARAEAANSARFSSALEGYAGRLAGLKPIILRSTDTVRTYAETPAGRAPCLGADRVRGLDELDASIRAAAAAGGRTDAVHGDAGATPAGR